MKQKRKHKGLAQLERDIYIIRGKRVLLDRDLANIYGVQTNRLNEQVKRNKKRFPTSFMFQLTKVEFENLKSQIAISSSWGGRRKLPYAFTEHGAIMLASVINSDIAIKASIKVVEAFVKLREILETHKELALKLAQLEQRYDKSFKVVFDALRQLMNPPPRPRKKIGYEIGKNRKK